jgi:hypothetical protein
MKSMCLTVVLAVASLADPSAQDIQPCTHEARFGLMGLARLQVARLNVVNVTPPDPATPLDPIHPPDPLQPPDPCHVAIGFLQTTNQPYVSAAGTPLIVELDLRPGQSAFVELNSVDAFRGSRELRAMFRATGLFTHQPPDPAEPEACGAVLPTLEIYDAVTGRSQVVENPLEIFGFNPQPEPPGAVSPAGFRNRAVVDYLLAPKRGI